AMALGTPRPSGQEGWSSEPFAPGVLEGLVGQVEIKAAWATLTKSLAARHVRGVLRLGETGFALEDLDGAFPGGRLVGSLTVRRAGEGTSAKGRIALANIDAAAIAPVTGRMTIQVQAEGTGLSPAALIGSLTGAGSVTLDGGQISGLDPKSFDAVT